MKIIEPSYEIIQCPDGEQCLAFLEQCARTCYQSADKITQATCTPCQDCEGTGYVYSPPQCEDTHTCRTCKGSGKDARPPSSHKLIRSCIERGHESVIEHMVISVRFIVDRGFLAEITRQRLNSFSCESSRYCNYSKHIYDGELTFIKPHFFIEGKQGYKLWADAMKDIELTYLGLIAIGHKPEEARTVLPMSLKTEIVSTANLRQWKTVLKQRTSPKAHPQMRAIMIPLLAELKSRIPIIFDDIEAKEK